VTVKSRVAEGLHVEVILTGAVQVSSGLVPDGRHFVSRARDEASSWRSTYKGPIPIAALAIVGGWDSEGELGVDGQVGTGPKVGGGGKVKGKKAGGLGLYMIEPSGLYWV